MEPSFLSSKDPINYMIEQDVRYKKDPSWEGLLQGSKAAVVAAPIGAAIQALRNKSPAMGALVSGLGVGALAGLSAAAIQKYKNLREEAGLRYHLKNIMDREQTATLPEPQALNEAVNFSRGFNNVYNPY